ncbi:glycerol-3-phosphate acyltransferase 2, mitochondrial-like isoform X2 [Pongo pygmaeus]|uniref:glycerol-3-phosphate acyltransferase 2, mitochondrial-like isoform X2 n=1 Tax=Pongo pygmaeus TaxID=9600 RepID=UPI0023E18FAB|nr:glycerol-3-phosphate acyltransferase 2, mitochondrial-like isoform X1 [Pongo pygmaeus]
MATMLEGRCQTQPRSSPSGRETSLWSSGLGMKLEAVTPFLGKYRPFVGRCCQTCTPKSWESLFHRSITDLGFCNVILVKEENTRFWGWLVRRLCYFLWSLEQHIPPCQDAPQKIMESTRVQNLLSGRVAGGAGEGQVPDLVKKEVQSILGHTQAPPCSFLVRLFSWALLRFLNCLFLNVQLHKGQMKMVQKAAQAGSPLVLLSTHKTLLDGILLPFLLLSQGLGVLRVAWESRACSPALRALLRKLGGLFLPPEANLSLDNSEGLLARAVVQAASAPLGLWTGALAVLRSLWSHWGCSCRICSRVHLAQPFSLQEYIVSARSCWGGRQTLEQLLQPIVLGQCTAVPDTEKEQEWTPITGPLLALKEEDQLLVRRLSCHVLSASVGSSAVMSTAIMATLLLVKHQKGVFLSQLLGEFSWLTEEILLRGFDVGFSGQLRSLLQHSLSLLRAHVALLCIRQGDLLVVPRPGPGLMHLARLSAELLPVFLSEAVGTCAVRGLLAGRVPPQGPWELQGILLLSQNELYCQILLLMHLLPQDLLLLKPCQSSYCHCQEVLDRLIQCGLLVAEELSQQSHCPDFFLFLCRLLSPLLKAFAQAAALILSGYTEQLFQFLQATAQEEGILEYADPKLAISAIWTFRDMEVLQQTPSPADPRLHLSPTFASRDNQEKLEQFIWQFICS